MGSIHNSVANSQADGDGGDQRRRRAPANGMAQFEPGELIGGRYQLIKRIGTGASSDVFGAKDTRTGRLVALKIVAAEVADNERVLRTFQREMDVVRKLDTCPWIVPVFDLGHERGRPYLVLPLFRAPAQLSLRRYCKPLAGMMDIDGLRRIALDIARGLDHAHRRGVFHRDVSPNNVVVTTDPLSAAVIDFGMASLPGRVRDADGEPTGGGVLTVAGLGTPGFVAPEVLKHKPGIDEARRDVYSLGAVLCWMQTGDVPPSPPTPARIRKLLDDAPRDLAGLIECMLDREPERRPLMKEVVESLESMRLEPGRGHDDDEDDDEPEWHYRMMQTLRLVTMVACLVVAVFLFGVLIYSEMNGQPAPPPALPSGLAAGGSAGTHARPSPSPSPPPPSPDRPDESSPAANDSPPAEPPPPPTPEQLLFERYRATVLHYHEMDKAWGGDELKITTKINTLGNRFALSCAMLDHADTVAALREFIAALEAYPTDDADTVPLKPGHKELLDRAIRQIKNLSVDTLKKVGLRPPMAFEMAALQFILRSGKPDAPADDKLVTGTRSLINSYLAWYRAVELPDEVSESALTDPDALFRATCRLFGRWGSEDDLTAFTLDRVRVGAREQPYVVTRAIVEEDGSCAAEVQLPESADPTVRVRIVRVAGKILGIEALSKALTK